MLLVLRCRHPHCQDFGPKQTAWTQSEDATQRRRVAVAEEGAAGHEKLVAKLVARS